MKAQNTEATKREEQGTTQMLLMKGRWLLLALTAAVLLVALDTGSAVAQPKSSVSHHEKMKGAGIDSSTGEINEDEIGRNNPGLRPTNEMPDIDKELEKYQNKSNSASAPGPKQEVQQQAAQQEAARQEALRQQAAQQEAARQEALRQQAAQQEAEEARKQQEAEEARKQQETLGILGALGAVGVAGTTGWYIWRHNFLRLRT
jgi:hypothetical protein